jgi:hypothetical protein
MNIHKNKKIRVLINLLPILKDLAKNVSLCGVNRIPKKTRKKKGIKMQRMYFAVTYCHTNANPLNGIILFDSQIIAM